MKNKKQRKNQKVKRKSAGTNKGTSGMQKHALISRFIKAVEV